MRNLDCSTAQKLMSPFIDSMTTPQEVEDLELHISICRPCYRQLQSYKSMRSLLARVERPKPPEDLVLATRVKLSHARNRNYIEQLENRMANILGPVAIPAVLGVAMTMLFFGILLGSFASKTVLAQDGISVEDQPVFALYKPVRTTEPTMIRFAVNDQNTWDEPLMIETHVDRDGRVLEYRIISGPQSPEVNRWIREMLSLAQFTPATAFGKPVDSKIILSFVAVRS